MEKSTKIIATIGPSCDSEEKIESLIKAGVNIFRFNFKHNTIDWHSERIKRVNQVAKKMKTIIGTLIDLQGPELRVNLPVEKIKIEKGHLYPFGRQVFEKKILGIALSNFQVEDCLSGGEKVFIADGYFQFEVVKKKDGFYLRSFSEGILKNRKNLNIPQLNLPFSSLIKRDFEGLKLAALHDIDYIALSFVRTKNDILALRKEMKKYEITAKIVAKIETKKALENLTEIINKTDGVMVARGDLGVEVSLEALPYWQKKIINQSLSQGKFVITATQMLESMVTNVLPTRAEISDIANAVYDGTDCVMLSAETASGSYPTEAVSYMKKTIIYAEKFLEEKPSIFNKKNDFRYSLCQAAFNISQNLKKNLLGFLVITESGQTAIILSRFRPRFPIFAVTPYQNIAESLTAYFGVFPSVFSYAKKGEITLDSLKEVVVFLRKNYNLKKGYLVILHGDFWRLKERSSVVRVMELK